MFGFFSKTNLLSQRRAVAIIDIGSGSVAVALVEPRAAEGERALIRASARKYLSHEEREEGHRQSGIVRLTKEVTQEIARAYAMQKDTVPVSEVVIVIHAPWIISRTLEAHERLNKSVKITHDTIKKIAYKILSGEKEASKKNVCESSIVRVELNGYSTSRPEYKIAREVRVVVLESETNQEFSKAVEQATKDSFPGRPTAVRSSTFVHNAVLREIATRTKSYLILDMTSEASACTAIRNGEITQHAVVPIGIRTIAFDTSKKSGIPADEVRSRLRMVADGTCSEDTCKRIVDAFTEIEPAYVKSFGEVFSTLAEAHRLPNTLVLSVPDDMYQWAEHFFSKIDFGQFTVTGRQFVVQRITSQAMSPYAVYAPNTTVDAGISLSASFVHIQDTGE